MQIKDVMTRNVEVIHLNDSVREAAAKMKELNVGVIPVIDGKGAVGILTDRDITVRAVAEGRDPSQIKVQDIMTTDIVACPEDTDLRDAAKVMKSKQIRRLLVKDDQDRVIGVLSLGDIAVSLGQDAACEILKEISEPAEPQRH